MRYRREPENPAIAAEHALQRRLQAERLAAQHAQTADDYCARMGLSRKPDESGGEHVARLRAHLRQIAQDNRLAATAPTREPGEDYE